MKKMKEKKEMKKRKEKKINNNFYKNNIYDYL